MLSTQFRNNIQLYLELFVLTFGAFDTGFDACPLLLGLVVTLHCQQ